MIELKELTHFYKKQKRPSLDHLSFCLPDHGFVLIKGKSGSGKTTLLNILSGIDSPTSGTLSFDGEPLNGKRLEKYQKHDVAVVFQDYNLLKGLTIGDNMRFAFEAAGLEPNEEVAMSLLRSVNLEDYEDIFNRYPAEVSGGQQQRISIARALIKKPRVLILDEPTSALDYGNADDILCNLKEMSKDILVLVASHDLLRLEKYADYTVSMDRGRGVFSVANQENEDGCISGKNVLQPRTRHKGFSLLSRLKYVVSLRRKSLFRFISSSIITIFALVIASVSFGLNFGDADRATLSGLTKEDPFYMVELNADNGLLSSEGFPKETEDRLIEAGFYRVSMVGSLTGQPKTKYGYEDPVYSYFTHDSAKWAIEIHEDTKPSDLLLLPDERFSRKDEFRLPVTYDEIAITSSVADYLLEYDLSPVMTGHLGGEPQYSSLDDLFEKGRAMGRKIVGVYRTPECEGQDFLFADDQVSESKRNSFSLRRCSFVCSGFNAEMQERSVPGWSDTEQYDRPPFMVGKMFGSPGETQRLLDKYVCVKDGVTYRLSPKTQYSYMAATLSALSINSFAGRFVFLVAIIAIVIAIFSTSSLFYYVAKKDEINLGILKSIGANKRDIASIVGTGALIVWAFYCLSFFIIHVAVCLIGDFLLSSGRLVMFPIFSPALGLAAVVLVITSFVAVLVGARRATMARPIQVIKEY